MAYAQHSLHNYTEIKNDKGARIFFSTLGFLIEQVRLATTMFLRLRNETGANCILYHNQLSPLYPETVLDRTVAQIFENFIIGHQN